MKYSQDIENLVTEIVNNEEIDYDAAVEVIRDTVDDLYPKSPKTHPGHSESCVCLRCRGIPVDEDGYPTQLKCVHNYLGRLKEIGANT